MSNAQVSITSKNIQGLKQAISRLKKQEPIQYILEKTTFFGHEFYIDRSAFIPRPETEEMVFQIIQKHSQPYMHILDLGTGSGCIAITLVKHLKQAHAWGLDVDAKALLVAKKNAEQLQTPVHWCQKDILNQDLPSQKWDIIVSNPPYIPARQKKYLEPRVKHYEPHQALFVPDDKPLVFYERIAMLCKQHLGLGGTLYTEINEDYGQAIVDLFTQAGFTSVQLEQDIQGKDRWVRCSGLL